MIQSYSIHVLFHRNVVSFLLLPAFCFWAIHLNQVFFLPWEFFLITMDCTFGIVWKRIFGSVFGRMVLLWVRRCSSSMISDKPKWRTTLSRLKIENQICFCLVLSWIWGRCACSASLNIFVHSFGLRCFLHIQFNSMMVNAGPPSKQMKRTKRKREGAGAWVFFFHISLPFFVFRSSAMWKHKDVLEHTVFNLKLKQSSGSYGSDLNTKNSKTHKVVFYIHSLHLQTGQERKGERWRVPHFLN